MKNLCKYSEKINKYFNNQLNEQQKSEIIEHINNCNSCKEEYALFNAIKNEFQKVKEIEIPEGYHQKLHLKLVKAQSLVNQENKINYLSFMGKFLPAAAAVLLVIVAFKSAPLFNMMNKNSNLALSSEVGEAMSALSTDNEKYKNNSKPENNQFAMNTSEKSVKDNTLESVNKGLKRTGSAQNESKKEVKGKSAGMLGAADMSDSIKPENKTPENTSAGIANYKMSQLRGDSNKNMYSGSGASEVGFESIAIETITGIEKSQNVIIYSKDEFDKFWGQVYKNVSPVPAVPEIDFEKYIVIGACAGSKSTGGYGVEITGVVENEKNVVITINETSPPEGSFVTQVITSPGHIIKIKKTHKEILFETNR